MNDTKVAARPALRGGSNPYFSDDAVRDISGALTQLLADMFSLYIKTKNFHWHITGRNFRDYHLMLDAQGAQIFATTDQLAERVRKVGGTTLRSIGHIASLTRITDNDESHLTAQEMLTELLEDNKAVVQAIRDARSVCEEHGDVASVGILEGWIDEGEERLWFLFEISQA